MYVLKDLFGDCPHVKIIEVLAENAGFDISRPEIHSEIGGAKTTVYSHIERLVKGGFVNKTRKVGNTQLYSLNLNDPRARLVVYLEKQIVTGKLEETMGKLGIPSIPEVKPVRALPEFENVFVDPEFELFQTPSWWEGITVVRGTVNFAEQTLAEGFIAENVKAVNVEAAGAAASPTRRPPARPLLEPPLLENAAA